ncbi:50S ribosomal protein L25/general stress protein Ctc [Peribacillus tepidiphilus]|uniref:50S ribosomal protein L25/general stress protein Ctc n=1 Tax=Peribacillus tepidiphilus TaxID=2652445 RepID=UPI00129161C2|nr:50S ribosomal protein L25/general stress protein Ctc [Peribacillus tepidiphilus]
MSSALLAEERKEFKRSTLSGLRDKGYIPAVLYGGKKGSVAISVDRLELLKTIREVGRNGIISLEVEGKQENVMLKDYQMDPLKNEIVHVDFFIVDLSAEIDAEVRVTLVGNSAGVKDGGVLQQSLHEVSVTAKPKEIPEAIEIDVTDLQVGDTITIGDIRDQYSITINHEDSETIASVLPPKQEEEINTGEEQEGGVPENEEGRETEASAASEAKEE